MNDARFPMIADAHLDLAMGAMEWNRDLRWSVAEIRDSERELTDRPDRAHGTVSFGALRQGNVGLVVATQIARVVPAHDERVGFHSPEQAWAQTNGQLAWYREMERCGELAQIRDRGGLEAHLKRWSGRESRSASVNDQAPIGYILSLEGADSIVSMDHLHRAWEYGLRAVGPAHYGPGIYAPGTGSTGGLTDSGRRLVSEMDRLGMILDVSHLSEESFWEALELFTGTVWASHSNCRALVSGDRQLADDQIQALLERDAVIGIVMDAWMLMSGWDRGESRPAKTGLSLSHAIDHIDHICQLTGDARHVGIGSDLDGGYGTEQTPTDIDTIADLQKLLTGLSQRGYDDAAIEQIAGKNFVELIERAWE